MLFTAVIEKMSDEISNRRAIYRGLLAMNSDIRTILCCGRRRVGLGEQVELREEQRKISRDMNYIRIEIDEMEEELMYIVNLKMVIERKKY
ncbi:uncharacterized protein H6S33_008008 [Morchella sextelata]|jgi:hypothetical protein|uniref:uncharacterized protein n=1 Tax=Morchella sextelata TaxID=1174677 RepID=UPI001D05A172|nr:uncharacterized protein H6S33_008008 [Morchella sextelata]KAH0603004.1 hypothetical protein H6S33_008008 [Morchella sextelata]